MKTTIVFVCAANVCRSPMAQAIFQNLVKARGLTGEIHAESRGFMPNLEGAPYHPMVVELCEENGIPIQGASAPFSYPDFENYDLIIAMDEKNLLELQELDVGWRYRQKIHLLGEFSVTSSQFGLETPDPIGRPREDFEHVFALIQDRCAGLLFQLTAPNS